MQSEEKNLKTKLYVVKVLRTCYSTWTGESQDAELKEFEYNITVKANNPLEACLIVLERCPFPRERVTNFISREVLSIKEWLGEEKGFKQIELEDGRPIIYPEPYNLQFITSKDTN